MVDYDPEYNGIEYVTVKATDLSKLHAQLKAYKGRIKRQELEPNTVGYKTLERERNLINDDLKLAKLKIACLDGDLYKSQQKVKTLEAEIVKLKAALYDKKFKD